MNVNEILGIEAEIPQEKTDALLEAVKNSLLENEDFIKSIPEDKLPKDYKNNYINQGVLKASAFAKNSLLKSLGFTENDFSDLKDEDKSVDKFVAKAVEKYKSKTPDFNKDIADIESKYLNVQNLLSEKEQLIETLKNGTNAEIEKAKETIKLDYKALQNAMILKENIIGDFGFMFESVYQNVRNNHELVLIGSDIEIRKKDNPSFKVTEIVDGKETVLTFEKLLEKEFRKIGVWKEKATAPQDQVKQKFELNFTEKSKDMLNQMKQYTN